MKRFFLIFSFVLTLLVPSVVGLFLEPDLSAENRTATVFPSKLSWETKSAMEGFLTDRVAFRGNIIRFSSYIDYFLFHRSMVSNVMIGENGQLFYNEKHQLVDTNAYLLGEYQVPEEQLQATVAVQNEIQRAMDERGVQYLVVVAPTKQAIYREDLPTYYRNAPTNPIKDQILTRLRAETNVDILDLTDAIIDEKALHPVYLKTDSHWNQYGAFRGYEEIIKHLRKTYPELPLISRSEVEFVDKTVYNQNLSKMLSLGEILPDSAGVEMNPKIPRGADIVDVPRSYPDPNYASAEFQMIAKENIAHPELPKAIMYRDSFAGLDGFDIGNLHGLLPSSFSSFVSYTQYQLDFNYIMTEIPNLVIYLVYEDNITRLGINPLYETEVNSQKPLYAFNTELNGDYYIPEG